MSIPPVRPTGVPERAVVHVGPKWTVKRYRDPRHAEQEAFWFSFVPWATPKLACVDGVDLVMQTCPVAVDIPSWRPSAALKLLLEKLHKIGVHHRDVHTKNVVMDVNGNPLLVDWETAVRQESDYSYDLYGTEVSGVAVPDLHVRHGLDDQWWGSPGRYSIGNAWEEEAPTP